MHQMLFALVVIVALGISIVGTIIHFRRLHPLAGMLLIPYLTWVSYAT
jgi:tryptophan-rich sensory protein